MNQELRNFSYQSLLWYKKLVEDPSLQAKRNLLIFSYIIASFFPLTFMVYDLYQGKFSALWNYCIPLLLLVIVVSIIIAKKRTPSILWHFTMMVAFAGFFLAAYLPHSRQCALFIMIAFVPYAFQLNGSRQGSIWSIFFLVSAAIVFLLGSIGVMHRWNLRFATYHSIMTITGIFIIFILNHFGQRQQERLLKNLIHQIAFDHTTDLPNKEILLHNLPSTTNFMMIIIRIQNFSELSTLFGYEVAERILRFSADTLRSIATRENATLFKLLGHEFGLTLPLSTDKIDRAAATNWLNGLWFELQADRMIHNELEICPVYRIGAALVQPDQRYRALTCADIALEEAARQHHGFLLYHETSKDREQVIRSNNLYSTLLENIRNHQLKVVYQPIVDTATGDIRWYEALLRVRKKNDQYESIFPYLDIARNTGLYNSLSRFVLAEVAQKLQECNTDISINITLSDVNHPGFMEEVFDVCEAVKLRPNRLILEIVESEELIEIDFCRRFVSKVQELGGMVAIDDFGSGYSNFSNLLNLSVDIVKINGSLMRSVTSDDNARNMIESIASFCHKAGKQIVAEYIENKEIHAVARDFGIHFSQGYYFGQPGEIPA